jgi:hypothetical protein
MDELNEPTAGAELVHRAARAWVHEAEAEFSLVPLVLIALEVDEPVELVADRLGDAVQLDDIGMRAVPASEARAFLAGRAEQAARMEDQARRLQEAHVAVAVGAGVPALEHGSAMESIMAHDPGYLTAAQEFGGRPKPRFLQEELEAGGRAASAARAEAEAASRSRREGKDR